MANLFVIQFFFKGLRYKILYLEIIRLKYFLKLVFFIVNNKNANLLNNQKRNLNFKKKSKRENCQC